MSANLDEFNKLEDLLKKVYLVADPGICRLLCWQVIAHRLPMDPVWTFIVGPSSSGKTEFINCLSKVQGIWPISSLTTNTLISGQKKQGGGSTSLLSRLPVDPINPKRTSAIFTFKDFTTVLSMNDDSMVEILGQLREVYDGKFSKEFGTGETKRWEGKVSMLSGVTGSIYKARELYAAMGERFALYSLIQPDRKEMGKRAIANVSTIQKKREMLSDHFKHFLDEVVNIPAEMPEIPKDLEEEILDLSEMVTRARSIVDREWKSATKEITFAHDPEGISRFSTQLTTYATAGMVMNQGPLEEVDRNVLYKIALDSIDKRRRLVLQELVKYTEVDTKSTALALNYPTNSVRRWLEDLSVLGLVDRIAGSNKDRWVLKDNYKQILARFEHIEMLKTPLEINDIQEAFPGAEEIIPDEKF